jgi:hypothetical protein
LTWARATRHAAAGARRSWFVALSACLAPSLAAIWWRPWFVTGDGPAHLYNAHIIATSLGGPSPFDAAFEVRWQPLPNWLGHLSLVGLLALAPPAVADRLMSSLTLLAPSAAIAWLWRRVGGARAPAPSVIGALAAMLGLNLAWLFGFASFLFGLALFALTLGLWWGWRDRLGPPRALLLAGLLIIGYFAHLITVAATVLALLVLAAHEPPRRRRLRWTAAAVAPLAWPAAYYWRLSRAAGRFTPIWNIPLDRGSLAGWWRALSFVDPLTLAPGRLPTSLCFFVGMGILFAGSRARHTDGWRRLGALLVAAGLVAPDGFGSHGSVLQPRLVLLGLAALLPTIEIDWQLKRSRFAVAAVAVALVLQSALIWDYSLQCNRAVAELVQARALIGRGQRVGSLFLERLDGFRGNAPLHADLLLGIETGNILWSNYEAANYYFPVHFRAGAAGPPPDESEAVSWAGFDGHLDERAARWRALVERYHGAMDFLVVWGEPDAAIAAVNARWFVPVGERGRLRVLRHR